MNQIYVSEKSLTCYWIWFGSTEILNKRIEWRAVVFRTFYFFWHVFSPKWTAWQSISGLKEAQGFISQKKISFSLIRLLSDSVHIWGDYKPFKQDIFANPVCLSVCIIKTKFQGKQRDYSASFLVCFCFCLCIRHKTVITSAEAIDYSGYHAQFFFIFIISLTIFKIYFSFLYLFYNNDLNKLCKGATIK